MKLIVTGGAGFIGSAFVRMLVAAGTARVVNLDKLTYAGNLDNLAPVADSPNYRFVRGDITDVELIDTLIDEEDPDAIVHFAAESHVDRSILSPAASFETNLRGTFTLVEAVRRRKIARYVHVSTDEVYGSLEEPLEADESYPLRPSSPYSASKAGPINPAPPVTISFMDNHHDTMPAPMKLHAWSDIPVEQLNDLVTRQVLHSDLITMSRLGLKKGAVVPRHQHVNEQITTLEKGRLRFIFDENELIVETGESLQIPSNVPHRVEALEDSVALDIFSPAREDWIRGDDAYLRR